jgi:hypothetical protein
MGKIDVEVREIGIDGFSLYWILECENSNYFEPAKIILTFFYNLGFNPTCFFLCLKIKKHLIRCVFLPGFRKNFTFIGLTGFKAVFLQAILWTRNHQLKKPDPARLKSPKAFISGEPGYIT